MASATTIRNLETRRNELLLVSYLDIKTGETLIPGTMFSVDANGDALAFSATLKVGGMVVDIDTIKEKVTGHYNHEVWLLKADAAKTDWGKLAYAADNQSAALTGNALAVLGKITDWKTGKVCVKMNLPVGLV